MGTRADARGDGCFGAVEVVFDPKRPPDAALNGVLGSAELWVASGTGFKDCWDAGAPNRLIEGTAVEAGAPKRLVAELVAGTAGLTAGLAPKRPIV